MVRLAIFLLGAGLFGLVLAAAFMSARRSGVTAETVSRALAQLVGTLLGAVVIAGSGGLIVEMISWEQQDADPHAAGRLVAALLFPVAVGGLAWWKWRARRDAIATSEGERMRREKPEPPGDVALSAAWDTAAALAPREAGRLAAARRACGRLLHGADAAPPDMEAMDCAIIIRRHIPDLVAHTSALCAGADADEQQALIDEMMQSIEKVAADAERLNERERAGLRHGLRVLHAHIANRTTRKSL